MIRSSRIRRHLTFANVASALALFLAIGGGTTAIALRGKNKVDSGDIRNGQVRTRDLAANAATGAKVNESTFTKVPDSDELDGIDSGFFQFGNGITGAIAGAVQNGVTVGQVDLGSATLRIDCEMASTDVSVRDDTGESTNPVPTAAVPTDVWIDGVHEALTSDGDITTAVNIPSSSGTVPVQVWTTDDVVTNAQLNIDFDVPNDRCTVLLPLDQNLPGAGPVDAAANDRRLPLPTTSGFAPR